MSATDSRSHKVCVIRLGCARNDVDAEELAGRLQADGFEIVAEPAQADSILVNTCGFIDAAKKDSIDQLLAATELKDTDSPKQVVAVGCLAERYGAELASELPEVDAVLGFDEYPQIADRLRWIAAGGRVSSHQPKDRRGLLPIAPLERQQVARPIGVRSAGSPQGYSDFDARKRLDDSPVASLKIASGCDRRCAFCAIPSFRGAYLSKEPVAVVNEAYWLVDQGVKEIVLVSENSTSYGKDLVGVDAAVLLAELSGVPGLEWIRMTYLQPAEMRPTLIDAICDTEHVVPYFDLPFQHAAASVLRRMRRFGDTDTFLALLEKIRSNNPLAGIRTNVIVGFPGESEEDLQVLADFLTAARADAIGVFGYSNEENTEGYRLAGQLSPTEIEQRTEWLTTLADELMAQRAEDRIGEQVQILIEETSGEIVGRSAHQGPGTDGSTSVKLVTSSSGSLSVGELVTGKVIASDGVDLIAEIRA